LASSADASAGVKGEEEIKICEERKGARGFLRSELSKSEKDILNARGNCWGGSGLTTAVELADAGWEVERSPVPL